MQEILSLGSKLSQMVSLHPQNQRKQVQQFCLLCLGESFVSWV